LRTCFAKIDGRPVQRIVPEAPVPMRLVDLSGLGDEERVDQARALAVEAARAGLNLACAPLLRLNVMRLGPEDHVVLLVLHHIVFDGGSIGVFASELAALYGAFASKLPSPLPPPRIQYPDFAIWQQRWLRGERLERQLAYWKGQLSGRPPRLALGTRRAPIGMDGLQGATRALLLPRELGAALESLSRRSGATLFMTLLTAFKMLLCRYTGQSDITIGTPVAGRTRPEMEDLIGFCVNLLPLRTRLEGDPTFLEALERVRQVCMAAYRHQEVPFGVMVKALRPERGLHRTPLFQATFMLQNTPPGGALRLPGLQSASLFEAGDVRAWARSLEAGTAPAVDDLSLHVAPVGPGLLAVLHYRAALFEAETADRLLRHLQELLKGIVAGPDRRLWSLPMVTEGERRQLLVDWNATEAPRPRERRRSVRRRGRR
jgi:hypothetical protein